MPELELFLDDEDKVEEKDEDKVEDKDEDMKTLLDSLQN